MAEAHSGFPNRSVHWGSPRLLAILPASRSRIPRGSPGTVRALNLCSLGIHGAILPFILTPLGFFLGRALGFLQATGHGFVYFDVVDINYVHAALVFSVVLIVYYLVWKYLIGFFNHVAGIAD